MTNITIITLAQELKLIGNWGGDWPWIYQLMVFCQQECNEI